MPNVEKDLLSGLKLWQYSNCFFVVNINNLLLEKQDNRALCEKLRGYSQSAQECSRTISFTHSTQVFSEFRLGTKSHSSPPTARNLSLYSPATSTVVSKQSATNAGENANTFFTPCAANSVITSSVYGFTQGSFPSLDWKQLTALSSGIPSFSQINRVVWKHCAR